MPWNKTLAVLLVAIPFTAAQADSCEYEKKIDVNFDMSGIDSAQVDTIAGDEVITGVSDSNEAIVKATICASSQKLLDKVNLYTEVRGGQLKIKGEKPDSGWSWGNHYAYIDLDLELPSRIALDFSDRSGDSTISGIQGGLNVTDRSGDLNLKDTGGDMMLSDRSGDVYIVNHQGSVVVKQDRSGDILIKEVTGSVEVSEDRSGDIDIRSVTQSVLIGSDRSGDIEVFDIQGDFIVSNDGSGGIDYERVGGAVDIPENKR